MIKKILIANRGEIALRVLCACKELGIQTVAVYSEADRFALHVRYSDEAICIGPASSHESYLNIPSIISAAELTNADAIHPGYGYLSESAYFAEVCDTCGIRFIGPQPATIELMGDKAEARSAMALAGLPIVPGTTPLPEEGPDTPDSRFIEEVGLPVIVKAVAGGGGRGMRVIREIDEFPNALAVARQEAHSAFGDDSIYLERYLEKPRHIEFQVLADQHGNVIHLGERECSIQRRHQKLLEESPSPALTPNLRSEMGQRVVEAVRSVGYEGAGTVEFLLDQGGAYHFIEMNTRVQVEHPVTEMVTGIDIVKEQIQISAGQHLSCRQEEVLVRGHAIECRINAEDPKNFEPSPGHIQAYHCPGGPGIRVDSAAYQDFEVTPFYDSMVAKLIAHGNSRQESISRLSRALSMFIIEGIKTSIPLHEKILKDPAFLEGKVDTSFLERLLGPFGEPE